MLAAMTHALLILPMAMYVLDKPALLSNPVFGYDRQVSNVLAITCGYVLAPIAASALTDVPRCSYFIWDTIASLLHSSFGFVVHGAACLAVFLFSFVRASKTHVVLAPLKLDTTYSARSSPRSVRGFSSGSSRLPFSTSTGSLRSWI